MALVTRAADASVDASTAMLAGNIPDLIAGEDLEIGPCYIAATGKVMASNGTAAGAAAGCHGFCARSVKSGQAVTLLGPSTRFRYAASGLTPGAKLYIGATAGRLDTAATTGDATGVAFAISATDIVVSRYA